MPRSRPTIGVVAAWLADRYASTVVSGVADAVRERGGNVLCFAGGRLGAPQGFEAEGNALYDLVGPDNVDAVVVLSGALVSFSGVARVEELCRRIAPLPIVSIALGLDGIPSVLVDTDAGMRQSIVHLIAAHDRRKIAFIRGPEANDEAQRRYRTYRDVLSHHDVTIDPRRIAPGDFTAAAGSAAVELLFDRHKVPVDAIVAANDTMALACLDALSRRGVRVPEDVAVVGFDDIEEARYASPPLTTVRQPLEAQGRKAAEVLFAMLAKKEPPERVVLPTQLVMRQSCGCPVRAPTVDDGAGAVDEARKRLAAERRSWELSAFSQALIQTVETRELAGVVESRLPLLPVPSCFLSLYEEEGWSRLLVGYDERGAATASSGELRFRTRALAPNGALPIDRPYAAVVEPLFFRERPIGLVLFELDPRDGILCEELRGQLSAGLERAHREVEIARLSAAETERARELARAQTVKRRRRGLRSILDATAELHRIQPLGEMLELLLDRVGSVLAAVESPSDGMVEGFVALMDDESELVIRASRGRYDGIAEMATLSKDELSRVQSAIERREIDVHPSGSAVPLSAGDLALGALYLSRPALIDRDVELIHILANQAAVAIRNAQLYELATVDRLTGTCVRAFFEQWMLRELRAAFRAEQPIAFLMVDVDDMKRINDTAGHLAGDQALRSVGRALRDAIRGSDCAGRYGGDEFGVLLPQTSRAGAGKVAEKILELLVKENGKTSGLPPVKISIGLAVLEPGDLKPSTARQSIAHTYFTDAVKALIQAADDGLYSAKKAGGSCSHEGGPVVWIR